MPLLYPAASLEPSGSESAEVTLQCQEACVTAEHLYMVLWHVLPQPMRGHVAAKAMLCCAYISLFSGIVNVLMEGVARKGKRVRC